MINEPKIGEPADEEPKTDASKDARLDYEAPRLLKKRSISRVTLFGGSAASGAGITNM